MRYPAKVVSPRGLARTKAATQTCQELTQTWPELQGSLVGVISERVGRTESKSWDGYLVLLTPAIAPSTDDEIEAIRYDTTFLRKLVATGTDLGDAGDVERLLRPLLPLNPIVSLISQASVLEMLPELLAQQGVPHSTTTLLIEAYAAQKPLMEELHKSRTAR